MIIGIFSILLVALTFAFAWFGYKLAAKRQPNDGIAFGTLEERLNAPMEPSVMGAIFGLIPFVLFVIALIVMSLTGMTKEG